MEEFFRSNDYSFGMEKQNNIVKEVPAGIRYLSDQGWFKFSSFRSPCIINKEIPGCGLTEYSLTGPEYVILCSPRKLLLQNKKDQHGDDVFLVKNELERDICVDIDISKNLPNKRNIISNNDNLSTRNNMTDEEKARSVEVFNKIYGEFMEYKKQIDFKSLFREGRGEKPVPYKIMVTYDSFHIIKDIIKRVDPFLFQKFYIVVDEFQSILHDARFKSTTEMGFLNDLEVIKGASALNNKVYFVSATPMMKEYMEMLDEFKFLPYYILDWATQDPTRVIKPDLNVYSMKSITSKVRNIIDSYKSGNYDSIVVQRNNQSVRIESKEAVFYVNSVNQILNLIKNNELTPDQVNILCADTEENRKKIRTKLGKEFSLGHIPIKGEPNKMFTFCTRTVYLGADFYSKCAKSFIFSDSNSDCLAVDISEDLPQILGRQRDNDNPWKNSADFFYRTTADYKKMKQEDFDGIIAEKMKNTNNLLNVYNSGSESEKETLAEKYKKDAKNSNYKDDYVAVDQVMLNLDGDIFGRKKLVDKPVINNLVKVNEIRAFNIQQIDYKDRFAVFSSMNKKFTVNNNSINKELEEFFGVYDSYTTMRDKLRYLCEYSKSASKELMDAILSQIPDSDDVKSYYLALGPQRLYELGYNVTRIKKELGILTFSPELLIDTIYSNFHIGDRIYFCDLKTKLMEIYNSINYKKTPKATDIIDFFGIREFKTNGVINGVKKRVRGYELISSHELELRIKLEKLNNNN